MSTDEFLQLYEKALQAQAAANTSVKVLEMRAKLMISAPTAEISNEERAQIAKFIAENQDWLVGRTLRFLDDVRRPAVEIAEYMDCDKTTVFRLCKKQKLDAIKNAKGEWMVSTLSVIHYLDGETQEE